MHYEKIARKVEYILKKLKYLKNNRPEDVEQFESDETLQMAILYAFHVCIEAIVDIVILIGTKEYERNMKAITKCLRPYLRKGLSRKTCLRS